MAAETGGHLNIVEYLLGEEADVKIRDSNGVNICDWTIYLFFFQEEKLSGFEVISFSCCCV